MLAKPLTGPSPFGAATERLSVLKSLQASRASYTLATSFEGMYGENRVSCIAFLTQVLKKHFFLSEVIIVTVTHVAERNTVELLPIVVCFSGYWLWPRPSCRRCRSSRGSSCVLLVPR